MSIGALRIQRVGLSHVPAAKWRLSMMRSSGVWLQVSDVTSAATSMRVHLGPSIAHLDLALRHRPRLVCSIRQFDSEPTGTVPLGEGTLISPVGSTAAGGRRIDALAHRLRLDIGRLPRRTGC